MTRLSRVGAGEATTCLRVGSSENRCLNFTDPFGLQGKGASYRGSDGTRVCDDPLIDESANTFWNAYGAFGLIRGLARRGLRAILGAFAGKEAAADAAAIGRGIGSALRGQATGKTAAIAEKVTRAGLSQGEAVVATQEAITASGIGRSFAQEVGENIVVSSVQQGSSIPVMVVRPDGSVMKGTADLLVEGVKVILSNVRF